MVNEARELCKKYRKTGWNIPFAFIDLTEQLADALEKAQGEIERLTARAERAEAEAQQHKRALEIVANIKAYTPNGTTLYVTSESIMDKEAALRFAVEAERDALKLKLISPKTAQKQI